MFEIYQRAENDNLISEEVNTRCPHGRVSMSHHNDPNWEGNSKMPSDPTFKKFLRKNEMVFNESQKNKVVSEERQKEAHYILENQLKDLERELENLGNDIDVRNEMLVEKCQQNFQQLTERILREDQYL